VNHFSVPLVPHPFAQCIITPSIHFVICQFTYTSPLNVIKDEYDYGNSSI